MEVLIPESESAKHLLKFRLEAEAKGGAVGYTDDIEILVINCDFEGP